MDDNLKNFQPPEATWEERASRSGLRSVLDHEDSRGMKNEYMDALHRVVLDRYLLPSNDEKILDFGCGIGRLTSYLGRTGAEIIGVDVTKSMTDIARKKYPEQIFLCYDGTNLPFENNYFDKEVSVFVLQHVTPLDTFFATAKELVRCLKKGGKIYLIEQVSKENSDYYLHRMPKDYADAFKGCKCIKAHPIRKSKSLFLSAISRGLIPRFLFPIIIKIELFLVKNKKITPRGYFDYLFVFEK